MPVCPIFCPASFSPLSLHLQCHSGWPIRHQELHQEMEWGTTFSGSLFQLSLHPWLHCTKELHKLLVITHLWFALCTCLLHMTKTSSNPWSSEGYGVLVCRELVTSKCMHSLYWISFLSETWGAARSTFSTNWVLTRSTFYLNWVLKHSEYMMDF
jgi:hypothetical protein